MRLHLFVKQELEHYQNFVDSSEDANPYHNQAWGVAIEKAYGFNMHYFGLFKDDSLVAVMPTILIRSLGRKKSLCSLPYCDLGGVLSNNEHATTVLISEVCKYASEKGYGFEYRASEPTSSSANANNQDITPLEDGTKVRMLFDLHDDVDSQLASFKPKLRSQIKKAVKNGVSARVINNPTSDNIDDFYQVFATNMRDLGSPVHSKDWFVSIFSEYLKNSFLVLVDYDGICVGGGIVIHTESKAVIPWASTLREYNKKAPNMLLYWEVLSEVIRRNIPSFDFGRSSMNEGTYRFKKQWGAVPIELNWKTLVDNKLQDEATSKKSPVRLKVEKVWQRLPLGLTTLVGPKIRKHISL